MPLFKQSFLSYRFICGLFLIKVLVSFALFGIYTWYYTDRMNNDIFKYYDDGKIMYGALRQNPADYVKMLTGISGNEPPLNTYYKSMNFWIKPYNYEIVNENKTLIRLNAFICLFSMNNYFIHALIFIFLSFIGLFAIFKLLAPYFEHSKYLLAVLIFLMPSTLFWSSAILKESLVFFNMGLMLWYLNKIFNNHINFKNVLLTFLFAYLLSVSKIYILILLIPGITSLLAFKFMPKVNKLILFTLVHVVVIYLFFNSTFFSPYNFPEIVVAKQHDFINMVNSFPNVGSKIQIPILESNLQSFIINTPKALINSFFRPFIFESHNLVSLFSALENIGIMLTFALLIFYHKKPTVSNTYWFWFSLSFTLLLFDLIGLTTPVLGALVRYKIPALPFLLFLLFNYMDVNKINTKIVKIWKKS
jgi:hypothetical protein